MLILLHLLGDIAFLGGILMQLYAFLSPVPWFSDNPNNSLLKFVRKLESSPLRQRPLRIFILYCSL